MVKAYIIISVVTTVIGLIGFTAFWIRKKTRVWHNCETCVYCSLIEPGSDGKLIYTCGCELRQGEKMHYYGFALPLYCGKWQRRPGIWFPEEVDDG